MFYVWINTPSNISHRKSSYRPLLSTRALGLIPKGQDFYTCHIILGKYITTQCWGGGGMAVLKSHRWMLHLCPHVFYRNPSAALKYCL